MGTRTKDQDRESCGSEVLEKGRGDGSGSAKPVASESEKATAFFFSLLWFGLCATMEMRLSRNRDGWVGRPMVGQVPVQAGLSTHGSVCAVLCCAVPAVDAAGHSLQGSTGDWTGHL